MSNTRHRPPHATFKIKELIELCMFDEAQSCTDENEVFYNDKIRDQEELFLDAQRKKMGVRTMTDAEKSEQII